MKKLKATVMCVHVSIKHIRDVSYSHLYSIQFNLFCSSDPEGGCNPQDIEHVNHI